MSIKSWLLSWLGHGSWRRGVVEIFVHALRTIIYISTPMLKVLDPPLVHVHCIYMCMHLLLPVHTHCANLSWLTKDYETFLIVYTSVGSRQCYWYCMQLIRKLLATVCMYYNIITCIIWLHLVTCILSSSCYLLPAKGTAGTTWTIDAQLGDYIAYH